MKEPKIEIVGVIRCKDCKYSHISMEYGIRELVCCYHNRYGGNADGIPTDYEGYCYHWEIPERKNT